MMVRIQISLEDKLQKRAQQRASESGVSLAEYIRRLVARDLTLPHANVDVTCVFNHGASDASDIAVDKDSMIAEAFYSAANS
jgi:hypothetical protein